MSQRVVQYQAVIQMAQMAPDIYDLPQLHRQMLAVLGIKDADKLVPLPDDQKPKDPVSENMAALRLEPLKAFFYQDHESHIKVHMMAMQDPIVMELIGQNPKAPMIQGAMMAHVAEHVGFAYRQKIEQQMGMPLPPEDEKLPPEMEIQLSGMMAQAAQQVLQQSQAQQAQKQNQQQQQDPMIQMQQQELQIKQQELQLKQQDMQIKQQEVQGRLELDSKRLEMEAMHKAGQLQQQKEVANIDAMHKAGQLQQQKSTANISAMGKAGDIKTKREQMQMQHQANQQKEKPTK
jgi:mitogen-activated protein kinase kinase kinase kinase 4